MTRPLTLATFVLSALLTGCLHPRIGPQSLPRDRTAYSDSLSDSWKEETLLNIVKVRYLAPPVFVDVGNVVASYNLAQTASAGVNVLPNGSSNGNLGGSVGLSSSPPGALQMYRAIPIETSIARGPWSQQGFLQYRLTLASAHFGGGYSFISLLTAFSRFF